jgi:hypothetical protein
VNPLSNEGGFFEKREGKLRVKVGYLIGFNTELGLFNKTLRRFDPCPFHTCLKLVFRFVFLYHRHFKRELTGYFWQVVLVKYKCTVGGIGGSPLVGFRELRRDTSFKVANHPFCI